MAIIQVTPDISIDENEISYHFIRASGPGGQNVNKVATAVQLRFDLAGSSSLSDEVRERLRLLGGKRITEEGFLIIDARRFRTQERNRKDALERLIRMIMRAAEKPKARRKTRPPAQSRRRRLDSKHRRGEIKRSRRSVDVSEE